MPKLVIAQGGFDERRLQALAQELEELREQLRVLRSNAAISRLGSFGTAGAPIIAPFIATDEEAPRILLATDADGNPVLVLLASGDTYDPKSNLTGTFRLYLTGQGLTLATQASESGARLVWGDGTTEYGYDYMQTTGPRRRGMVVRVEDETTSTNSLELALRKNDDSAELYRLVFRRDFSDALPSGLTIQEAGNPVFQALMTSPYNIRFLGNGSALLTLTHAATAQRSITFPDKSGTVALTSDLGAGSMNTVKESGVQVGDADITTLDFGAGFDITEFPDKEINISLDFSEVAPTHAQLGGVGANDHHTQSHNHSASADGTTLSPAVLNIPSSLTPSQTAEGQAVWDSDNDQLTVGTGTSRKTLMNQGDVAGGELTGTYPNPSVATTHAGSAHHAEAHTLASHTTKAHSELTGVGADDHHAESHAARHAENAADELLVENLGTASLTSGQVPKADGLGGLTMGGLAHTDLSGVTSDQHHSRLHALSADLDHDKAADRVVVVSKAAGAQFSSVAAAVSWVNTNRAAATDWWTVLVFPGQYTEDSFTINSRISVVGLPSRGINTVAASIILNANQVLTLQSGAALSNIQVHRASFTTNAYVVDAQFGDPTYATYTHINNCNLSSGAAGAAPLRCNPQGTGNAGALVVSSTMITGTTGLTNCVIAVSGGGTRKEGIFFLRCTIEQFSSTTDGGVDLQSTVQQSVVFNSCHFYPTGANAPTVPCIEVPAGASWVIRIAGCTFGTVPNAYNGPALILDGTATCYLDSPVRYALLRASDVSAGKYVGLADHGDLSGVTADQHHAQDHSARHQVGGADGLVDGATTPSPIAASGSSGVGTLAPRMDHVHAHPSGLGTDLHHAQSHGASDHTDRTRSVFLNPNSFVSGSGAPQHQVLSGGLARLYDVWSLDASVTERITTSFQVPMDWASGALTFKLVYQMASATTGNVSMTISLANVAEDQDATKTADASSTDTFAVPATAMTRDTKTFTAALTPTAAGDVIRCVIQRDGGNANDTATGDLHVLGVIVEYTADM